MAYPYTNPYQPLFSPFAVPQPVPQTQNVLPAQQVLQASGKTSVESIRMAPNSSVLVMDTTAPIVWLCTSDGLGNVTSAPYDITPHKDAGPAQIGDLEARLLQVEKNVSSIMQKWEDIDHAESNDASAKSKQTVRDDE